MTESPDTAPRTGAASGSRGFVDLGFRESYLDRYSLLSLLDSKGQSETWKGRDEQTGAEIVLKITEGQLQGLEPYIPGVSLESHLKSIPNRLLGLPGLFQLAQAILGELQGVHDRGCLHEDIKPSNIVVDPDIGPSSAKLIDFEGGSKGTLRYMSPEQAGSIESTPGTGTDLYSLGAVLFECLTGGPLFPGLSPQEVLQRQLSTDPVAAGSFPEGTPRGLEEFLRKLLRKDPRDRYHSARAALTDLQQIAEAWLQGSPDPVLGRMDARLDLTDPSFVGRQSELARVQNAWESMKSGNAALIAVEAVSGGGKSRFLGEIAKLSPRSFVGIASDRSAQRPYQLLSGVVAGFLERCESDPTWTNALRSQLEDQAPLLCSVFPELRAYFGLEGSGEAGRESLRGPENLAEGRTLRALTHWLEQLGSRAQPALVLLDDVQWADESSLALLNAWARPSHLVSQNTMVVLAFRTEEIAEAHPLRRLPSLLRIPLPLLGTSDLGQMLESMAGPLPPEALPAIARCSEGNPFMAGALLQGMIETRALQPQLGGGWQLTPVGLAELQSSSKAAAFLTRRLQGLPEIISRLLGIGAVLGKSFDVSWLSQLSDVDPVRCREVLEDARKRHLVLRDPGRPGRVTFVHDQVRERLLELLPDSRRRILHTEAAESLLRSPEPLHSAVAFHFDAAGTPERGWEAAVHAAREARSQLTFEAAEASLRIALRGFPDVLPVEATIRITRLELLREFAEILLLRAKYPEADQVLLEQALPLADHDESRAEVELLIAESAFRSGDPRRASEALKRALELLGSPVPQSTIAWTFAVLGQAALQTLHTWMPRLFIGRRDPLAPTAKRELLRLKLYSQFCVACFHQAELGKLMLWAHLQEMNLSEKYPVSTLRSQAYANHAVVMTALPAFARGRRYGMLALEQYRRQGDLWGEGHALHHVGIVSFLAARFPEALKYFREAYPLLERSGDRWETITAKFHVASCLYEMGELRDSAQIGREVYEDGLEVGDAHALQIGVAIWASACSGRISNTLIETEVNRPNQDLMTRNGVLGTLALHFRSQGRLREALALLIQMEKTVQESKARNGYIYLYLPWLLTLLRENYETAEVYDRASRASLLGHALKTARRSRRIARRFKYLLPRTLRESAYLEAIRGNFRQALVWIDESIACAEENSQKFECAHSRLARARILLGAGQPGDGLRGDRKGDGQAGLERALRDLEEMGADPGAGFPFRSAESNPRSGSRANFRANEPSADLLDRFQGLLEAGRAIVTASTREAVLTAAQEATSRLLRGNPSRILTAHPESDPTPMPDLPLNLIRKSRERNQPISWTEGLPDDPSESCSLSGVRSMICAPITAHGQTEGFVFASHREIARLFGAREERMAGFIATLAGAALENADRYERLSTLSEERSQLHQEAAAAVAIRDQFLSIASHELRTPLTPLALQIQTLQSFILEGKLDQLPREKQARLFHQADLQVRRITHLVENLLDVSRINSGNLHLESERFELADLVQEVIDRLSLDDGSSDPSPIELKRLSSPVEGHWDRFRLDQVVTNLLINAKKYGQGRPIQISVETTPDPRQAVLVVRDQGIGIAPNDQARIFDLFERAVPANHFGGLGLGLFIVKKIVALHQGHIQVQSQPGEGSTFTLRLPLQLAP